MSSPLSQQVVQAKWGGFHLKDLFEIKSSIKRFDANKVTVLERGLHPYIIRSGSNNGQRGYLKENEQFLNEGNTISFGQDTATLFYQNKPYFTGDKINVPGASQGTRISVSRNNFDMFRISVQTSLKN